MSFKEGGICEAIEIWGPPQPTFRSRQLIGQPFNEIKKWFKQIDKSVEFTATGLESRTYGLALYLGDAKRKPRDPVEAVLVFERGYYENQTEG